MPTHHLIPGASLWAMEGVVAPPVDGIEKAAAAGFASFEVGVVCLTDEIAKRVQAAGMRLVVQCYPMTGPDIAESLDIAKKYDAIHVNVHAATPHLSEDETVNRISRMIEEGEKRGLPVLFETHRGRVTQDLYRTAQLCRRLPKMKLTLDVSHYIVTEEKVGPTEELKPLLDVLLDRVEMIHGRISNGQQIQVDVGDGSNPLAQSYRKLWGEAMRRWRARSPVGSVLIFEPELGPPDYAIRDLSGKEFSSRWEQSLVIKRLGEEAWKDASAATEPLY
jgi:sugar phosphate isomerase/epimerase